MSEVLRGHSDFIEWEHYPPDDVRDPETHAQYFFHAHPPDDRPGTDYGHFHTFLSRGGIPEGVHPVEQSGARDGPCHLVAISMTREGLPHRLFTTNRWVTGETWYAANDVVSMLDRFQMDLAYPSRPLNRWLSAMVVLCRPQIEWLIRERDLTIAGWQRSHPDCDVFEDRRLEVTSSVAVSVTDQLRWLDGLSNELAYT